MKYCFGVDIGGTTVKLGLFSEAGAIVEKWEIVTRTENEGAAILPDVAEAINGKLEQHGIEKEQVLGIGVGVPAPVTVDGIVNGSANLGWKYKNAKKELEELTGLTAEFGNDANVAALGEMWKGGGVGYRNMIMVTLGTGVGGGIIINGKILTGENGAGGEIGHMCVNLEETDTCGCGGHGCLEQYASATGISRLARKKMEHETRATILTKEDLSAKAVLIPLCIPGMGCGTYPASPASSFRHWRLCRRGKAHNLPARKLPSDRSTRNPALADRPRLFRKNGCMQGGKCCVSTE